MVSTTASTGLNPLHHLSEKDSLRVPIRLDIAASPELCASCRLWSCMTPSSTSVAAKAARWCSLTKLDFSASLAWSLPWNLRARREATCAALGYRPQLKSETRSRTRFQMRRSPCSCTTLRYADHGESCRATPRPSLCGFGDLSKSQASRCLLWFPVPPSTSSTLPSYGEKCRHPVAADVVRDRPNG